MPLPDPFNSVKQLAAFTSFREGAATGADSVREGTFPFSAFEQALQDARVEIYRRTGERDDSEFTEARLYQLANAERYLATANLYPKFGERISTAFPESNIQSVSEVMVGADTPPPSGPGSKTEFWVDFMYQKVRGIGLSILYGQPWGLDTVAESEISDPWTRTTPNVWEQL